MQTYQRSRLSTLLIRARLLTLSGELPRASWAQRWRRGFKPLAVLGLALLILVPALLAANGNFSDVPADHPFYLDINAIYGARITGGCGPGVYCPDAAVTRGQMAAFLNRGLGRVSFDGNGKSLNHSVIDLAVVTIKTGGGASGGTGYVKVDAWVDASTSGTSGCPCNIDCFIEEDISEDKSFFFTATLNNHIGTSNAYSTHANSSLNWVFQVPTQTIRTYRLKAFVFGSGALPSISVAGALTAVYIPLLSIHYSPYSAPTEGGEALPNPAPNK
jgi:hypothetical protein